jgi:hypothetical protein
VDEQEITVLNKMKKWHIILIEKVQKYTGLSNYQIIWLGFFRRVTNWYFDRVLFNMMKKN